MCRGLDAEDGGSLWAGIGWGFALGGAVRGGLPGGVEGERYVRDDGGGFDSLGLLRGGGDGLLIAAGLLADGVHLVALDAGVAAGGRDGLREDGAGERKH